MSWQVNKGKRFIVREKKREEKETLSLLTVESLLSVRRLKFAEHANEKKRRSISIIFFLPSHPPSDPLCFNSAKKSDRWPKEDIFAALVDNEVFRFQLQSLNRHDLSLDRR